MKILSTLSALGFVSLVAAVAFAAVTVKYHNGDSKKYEWDAVCAGAKAKVVFEGNTTSTTTIQGSSPCTVKTLGGDVSLANGDSIEIKDGKITKK